MEGGACRKGTIRRKGYTATRKSKKMFGLLGKLRGTKYTVKSTCVKDTGASGHGEPVIGPLKKGALKDIGYDANATAAKRHEALAKAVAKYGRISTLRKLGAIATLTERTVPSRSLTYKTDRNYVSKHF